METDIDRACNYTHPDLVVVDAYLLLESFFNVTDRVEVEINTFGSVANLTDQV